MIRALLAAAAILTAAPVDAQVRPNVADLTPAQVAALERGFNVMRSRDDEERRSPAFRTSLLFWANVHAHFGPDCRGPVTGQGMTGVEEFIARAGTEDETWCSCVHGADAFLTWHRIFIDQFEIVLRAASGDPTLMLPYWDYSTQPRLPVIFRRKTASVGGPNPLRVEARRGALNAGSSGVSITVASSTNAMAATDLTMFRRRLEQSPHDSVHCAVGVAGCGSGFMGAFATAGSDPIFWLHHANVDRLYECWMDAGEGRAPTGAMLDTVYAFPNRNGNIVRRRVGDYLTPEQLGYDYAVGAGCPPPAAPMRVAAAPEPVELGPTTEAPVEPADRATLVISGVHASAQPGAMFDVYLGNESGVRVHVGVITFMGETGHHGGEGRFEFDATEAAKMLRLDDGARPVVFFEATSGLDNSTPATSGINPDAVVTYRKARLVTE